MVLSDYKSTSNEKAFCVKYSDASSVIFFGNVEQDDSVWDPAQYQNQACLSDLQNHIVVHNMYDSRATLFQNITARRHQYPYLDTYDYQYIYKSIYDRSGNRVNNGLRSIVQTQNTFYAIDGLSTVGHSYPNSTYYEWLAQDNGYSFPFPMNYDTMIYDAASVSVGHISSAISAVFHDVKYNTLYEIPGNIQHDYSSGAMIGNTVRLKNQYDESYTSQYSSSLPLMHAREYTQICNCNDQVYLQYKTTLKYKKSSTADKKVREGTETEVLHRYLERDSDITPRSTDYKLPHIEMLKNLNRGAAPSNHKSSLYSLTLNTQFLKAVSNPKIKENLRSEIKNCIRQIVEKIAPANTQLFSVAVT